MGTFDVVAEQCFQRPMYLASSGQFLFYDNDYEDWNIGPDSCDSGFLYAYSDSAASFFEPMGVQGWDCWDESLGDDFDSMVDRDVVVTCEEEYDQ